MAAAGQRQPQVGHRGFIEDPAAHAISDAVQSLNLEHHFGMVRTWYADPDDERQRTWAHGAFSADKWLSMTPAELYQLSQEIGELFAKWATRPIPDDGRVTVSMQLFNYGTIPLGALLGGALGQALGLRPAMWAITAA